MTGKYWYSVEEVAHLLDVTRFTIHRWRREKRGPPWRLICGRVRYNRIEFDRWLNEQKGPYPG